jgi:pimeloyl-ACP methyl ester carboxylesterase
MATVELAGRGTVAYQWSGEGPEVVALINGSVFNFHQWDMQALPIMSQALHGRCRFLQYDYIGVGGSSAKTTPFNMSDLADELRDLLDALEVGSVHLLGISKGSLVGQAFLIRHRERAKSFCGLGNPNLLSESGIQAFALFRERVEALESVKELWPQRIGRHNYTRILRAVYIPAMFGKSYHDLSLGERLRAFIMGRMVYSSLEGTFVQTMADLFSYYASDIAQEVPFFAEGLSQVRGLPILLLNGTADDTTPVQMSRDLVQVLRDAELVEFEGVTHMGSMLLKKMARPIFERYVTFMDQVLAS